MITVTVFGLSLLVAAAQARAETGGCLKYGAAGALAGHAVGHGVKGALAGCATGMIVRHESRNADRARARAAAEAAAVRNNGGVSSGYPAQGGLARQGGAGVGTIAAPR